MLSPHLSSSPVSSGSSLCLSPHLSWSLPARGTLWSSVEAGCVRSDFSEWNTDHTQTFPLLILVLRIAQRIIMPREFSSRQVRRENQGVKNH